MPVEHLDPMILIIGHVDVARGIDVYIGRSLELSFEGPLLAPFGQKRAVVPELLNPMIVEVGDIDIS